jgi:hypothetical protein
VGDQSRTFRTYLSRQAKIAAYPTQGDNIHFELAAFHARTSMLVPERAVGGTSSFACGAPWDVPVLHCWRGGRHCSLESAEVDVVEQSADQTRGNLPPSLGIELVAVCEVETFIQSKHSGLHSRDDQGCSLEHRNSGETAIVMAIF